jgi:outer membrane protein assembly factor BamC
LPDHTPLRRHRARAGIRGRDSLNASSATILGPDTSGQTSTSMLMTTNFPTRLLHPTPLRVATVTLCLMLGGCTVVGDWFSSDRTDYKGASKRTQPLEVPPDLTQLQRDSRYLPQGGVVTASDLNKPGGATAPAEPGAAPAQAPVNPEVALAAAGNLHLERNGDQRWLSTQEAPELVLPKVRAYWQSQGYTLTVDEPKTGILETDWKQNRTKLPGGTLGSLFSNLIDNLSDSGLRDRFRTRLERRADGGTEIYVTHFGAAEEVTGKDSSVQTADVKWVPRQSDPGLEAQQLSQLMLSMAGVVNASAAAPPHSFFKFGEDDDAASAPATGRVIPSASTTRATTAGTGPNGTSRARIVAGQTGATMQVDDNFDRSWRRIGLALDHGGFTVEDRDRAQGLYYVRYVDAKEAAKDEPGFFSKFTSWFGSNGPSPVGKYRISIKAPADSATVTVLNDQGQPDNSQNAQRIVSLLVDELK